MKNKRTTTIAITVTALAILAAFGMFRNTTHVSAQDTAPSVIDRISFGMVGITAGQTMRINVSNIISANGSNLPPGPVRVAFIVIGSRGQLIRNAKGEVIRKVVDLERGDSAFLDVNYDELPPGPIRPQVRAVVTVQYQPAPGMPADISEHKPFMPSVEVINNANGRTQFVLTNPAAIRGFNPQPDPPIEP